MYLQHYAWVIKKRLWLIALGMLLCVGATTAVTSLRHPVFEATATIEVADPNTDVFGNQADAVTDALQVTGISVLQAAANKLPGTSVATLQNAISAFTLDNTQLIAVQADASTPQQAVAFANTVAQVFIQQKLASEIRSLQTAASQLATQVAAARTKLDQDQQQLTQLQANNASADQIQQANNQLATDQANYDTLSTSYSDIQTREALVNGSLRIDQLANPPTGPTGISRNLAIAIAAALSLVLMLLLVLLLDWIDVTIKTPEDVAQLAGLEPLGSVPAQKNALIPFPSQGTTGNDDLVDQAFTVINAHFHSLYRGQRSLMVTGLRQDNGASTTATWLAVALAQAGMRVLLVDANLRRPSLHQTFHVVNSRGLGNTLGDTYTIQKQPAEIVSWLQKWTTQLPNLWLLPAGPLSVAPTTVLRSLELQKLVTWLLQLPAEGEEPIQKLIDIIIFDTPALLEGADATALALLCDSTVLVVEAARERKDILKKASASLRRLGAPVLGIVVNRQKPGHRPYLYIDRTSQEMSADEKNAGESPTKYAPLRGSVRPAGNMLPRPQAEAPLAHAPNGRIEMEQTTPLPDAVTKAVASASPYRVPPRTFYTRQAEEQDKH